MANQTELLNVSDEMKLNDNVQTDNVKEQEENMYSSSSDTTEELCSSSVPDACRKYLSPRAGEQLNWFKRIWSQIDGGNVNDYSFFHMRMADGTYISVLDHGRIVDSVHNGRVFYVMIMDLKSLQRHYGDCLELVEK
ncbi:MAG: hypothetical protein ACLR3N_04935 [Agathobacter rectalis]